MSAQQESAPESIDLIPGVLPERRRDQAILRIAKVTMVE
jgi:hypothetical protein